MRKPVALTNASIALEEIANKNGVATLRGTLPPSGACGLAYTTRTGALLRIGGAIAGAFDAEHALVGIDAASESRELTLEVELASTPTHGLPSRPRPFGFGGGPRAERPATSIAIVDAPPRLDTSSRGTLPLFGHGHLDLAWLWTFAEGRRKALRTLANALQMSRRDPSYIFLQSQPALYAGVERDDPAFFAKIVEAVRAGTIDASVAALWVETDCNIPSGETLLRQLSLASHYSESRLGMRPSVAWLPDSFGFPNTLPQLLRHAGIRFFATTKLQWNDTYVWPHPQFVWLGPDGSNVLAAVIDAYGGDPTPERTARALERHEPLVVGYGDGGGGPNDAIVAASVAAGSWSSASHWFEALALRADKLPRVDDELYLETHRGVWTTHHDVKSRRFALEAALDETEELVSWAIAVRANRSMTQPMAADLRDAWPLLTRGDFHDVVSGTSIAAVYGELDEDYTRAERIVDRVRDAARSLLPKGELRRAGEEEIAPREDDGAFVFENEHVHARVRADGTIVDLNRPGEPSLITGANVLRAYGDTPREWEAWNIDRRYFKYPKRVRSEGSSLEDDGLIVRYRVGKSKIVLRISLGFGEPFLRVAGVALWEERRTLLRMEHWLAIETTAATFGSPHGTIVRTAAPIVDATNAKYEVPGQRFARADGPGGGLAVFATDSYGWSARPLARGGIGLGLSLLRGPNYPDPNADRGEQHFSYALLPLAPGTGIGAVEQVWREYAYPPRVRLFTCEDPSVLVVACKPADDDDGLIVRVRECDGASRKFRLRCGGRAREVVPVDGCERPIEREAAIDDYSVVGALEPYEIRTFRVRF